MKKPSVTSFLIILMLAAAVCIQGKEQVKDSYGNPVKVGEKYYIQPVNNNGGGLVPAAITFPPFCPLGITILPNQRGVPVSFAYPYIIPDTIIETSSIINIEFNSDFGSVCNEFSKLWAVDDSSSASKEPAIIIGGKRGSRNSAFTIEKDAGEYTYKLTTSTGTVGTTQGAWSAPQLLLTNDEAKTLLVKFKKVDDATTATTSTSRVEKLGLRMFPFY